MGGGVALQQIGFFLGLVFAEKRDITLPRTLENVTCVGKCKDPADAILAFANQPEEDQRLSQRLVAHYLGLAERGGTDVRLDIGAPFRPRAWPRVSLDPSVWQWKEVLSHAWPDIGAHINVREVQAATIYLRWRFRKACCNNVRFLPRIDSQVGASVLTKGRTSSLQLRQALRRFNAEVLASGVYPLIAHVSTQVIPADRPSRRYGKKKQVIKATASRKS